MDSTPTDNQQIPQLSPPIADQETKQASPEQTKKELREAIQGSNDVLICAKTTLTLFPDTLSVDRAKLTVTKHTFFSSAEVMSIPIEDVLNVTATVGPYFGTVKVASRILTSGPYKIGKFKRDDALKIKHITQGYVIALQRQIDCSALHVTELATMLEKLGQDEYVAA